MSGAITIGDELMSQASALLEGCRRQSLTVALAESCTGGLVAGTLTAVPGSSDVVDRSYVTYSNLAKTEMLGVSVELIEEEGAVSQAVAQAMLEGLMERSRADLLLSLTGIAGPGGRETQKPVGLVYFAAARRGQTPVYERQLFGDAGRAEVRALSVARALTLLASLI